MNIGVMRSRAMQQASANTETEQGEVLKTYLDGNGNVSHADVRLPGQPKPLPRVPNSSGLRLAKGAPVTINWRQGSRYAPHITGGAGSAGGGFVAGAVGSGSSSGTTTSTATDFSATVIILGQPDDDLPLGLTMQEGANVLFEDTAPTSDEDGPIGGNRFVHARPRVETELPDPTGLAEGTCVDLIDDTDPSCIVPVGMYRLATGQWIRRDSPTTSGGGGSDVTTADRNRWNTAGTTAASAATNATQALANAAAAQSSADAAQSTADSASASATSVSSEVLGARSRYAISGANGVVAYVYANLQNHINAIWTALCKRTANPNGVAAGWVLQADGNDGVVFAAPSTSGSTLSDPLEVAHGGTGAGTASAARANLGAAPLAWTINTFVATTGDVLDPTEGESHS